MYSREKMPKLLGLIIMMLMLVGIADVSHYFEKTQYAKSPRPADLKEISDSSAINRKTNEPMSQRKKIIKGLAKKDSPNRYAEYHQGIRTGVRTPRGR